VATKAIENARNGKGPTLIVGNTYRHYGHHMGDPGTSYRTKEEIEEWKKLDPIVRLETYLLQKGIAAESELKEIHQSTELELDEAVKFAIESPEPKAEEALEDIYCKAG
jgi:pyruvate dehydrogenase E1 component alpha subunit